MYDQSKGHDFEAKEPTQGNGAAGWGRKREMNAEMTRVSVLKQDMYTYVWEWVRGVWGNRTGVIFLLQQS